MSENAHRSLSIACMAAALALCLTRSLSAQPRQTRDLAPWSLGAAPIVTIGGDGTPATEFLRVQAVFRLRDGLIAVVNGGNSEIRIFDDRGTLLRTFGRVGAGPGEFRSISWAGRSGDTAFVFDGSTRRISSVILGNEPRLVNSTVVRAEGSRGAFFVSGKLANGQWLVTTYISPGWAGPPGVNRLPGSAGLMPGDATGDVRWLAEFPSAAIVVYNPTGDIKQAVVGPIAFSPWFYAVATGPYVWIGESGSDSLVRVDSRSSERVSLRLPFARVAPSRALVAAARERELNLARDSKSREWTDAKHSTRYLPRALPFFAALVPGPGGELWVRGYADPADSADYVVIDAAGNVRGRVRTPPGFRVQEVGTDYALGTHEDEDGVESVRLYRLSRR